MKRISIDKEIKAKTAKEAAEKFAKVLTKKGYEWVAEEMVECVENAYYYMSNASDIPLERYRNPVSPRSNDWSYYWGIENIDDNLWYAWFIEREVNND